MSERREPLWTSWSAELREGDRVTWAMPSSVSVQEVAADIKRHTGSSVVWIEAVLAERFPHRMARKA